MVLMVMASMCERSGGGGRRERVGESAIRMLGEVIHGANSATCS